MFRVTPDKRRLSIRIRFYQDTAPYAAIWTCGGRFFQSLQALSHRSLYHLEAEIYLSTLPHLNGISLYTATVLTTRHSGCKIYNH